MHWCLRVETHPCSNVVGAVITFSINWKRGHHVTCVIWNEPQVSSIQLYEQPSPLNDAWVWAGGCKRSLPRYAKGWSRTCYQECGCHLLINATNNLTASRKRLQRLWQHRGDRYHAVPQTYNNCAKTNLGGGVMSPFVPRCLPSISLERTIQLS